MLWFAARRRAATQVGRWKTDVIAGAALGFAVCA